MVDDVDRAVARAAGDLPGLPPLARLGDRDGPPPAGQAAEGGVPGAVRGHGAAADRAAQLHAAGRRPGVRERGRRLPRRVGPAVGGRADHRGLGRVPGDRLRAGHAGRRAGPGRPLLGPRLPVGQRPGAPAGPGRPGRTDGAGPARPRRRPRCTATRSAWRSATCGRASPSWRSTCCATARCGTGRSGGTSTSSCRSATADHDTYRQVMFLIGSLFRRLAPGDPHRVRVDEDRERYMWTRMREHLAATGTDPADCLYVCGAFHAASRVAEFGVDGAGTLRDQPAHRHRLAARPDPVQPRGDRGAVRPGRGLGVDRRDRLGEERQAHRRHSRSGWPGRRARRNGQEDRRRTRPRPRPRRRAASRCGPADRLPAAAAGPRPARRGRAARLVGGDRARRAPQRLPRLHRRRDRGVRDVDPARRDARPGQAHAVRLPGRGGHLHREGRRAGPARRAPPGARS